MDSNAAHVSLYMPTELREELERSAAANDRSLSAELRTALRVYVSSPSATKPTPRSAVTLVEAQAS